MKLTQNMCLLFAVFALSACGKEKVQITNVDLNTSESDSITYVNMDAEVKIGNLDFPSVDAPIMDPKTMKNYGVVRLSRRADGTNHLQVSVDYEAVTKLDAELGQTMPNGRELPEELGTDATTIVGIPVFQQSRVYVGGSMKGTLYVGAALTVADLDRVFSKNRYPLNIFYSFPFSDQLTGYAGLFTSSNVGESGFGVFAKKEAQSSVTEKKSVLSGGNEAGHLKMKTMYRLERLLKKSATLQIQ